MNLIRLYYNKMDIQPRMLLHQFLRYIGFYVEEITDDTIASAEDAVAEIYIISDAFVTEQGTALDVECEERLILVCRDGWEANASRSMSLIYDVDADNTNAAMEAFLQELIHALARILETQKRLGNILADDVMDWEQSANAIAASYLKHNLLPTVLYSRCLYRQAALFRQASNHYQSFIDQIISHQGKKTDLKKYAVIYAMYELDLICEINSYPLSYDPEGILLFCEKLLHKSDRNEQLLILHADIQFELMDMWSRACDEYLNSRLEHCVYPKYKFGRIISLYLKEYKNSIEVFQKAIEQKGDYFSAWYQIGLCQEDLGKYQEAVGAYEKVISLLRGKCGKHLLAPVELEYLYKSVLKSERIYRKCLGDYVMADCYDDLAEHVKLEAKQTVYLEQVWPAAKNNTECKDILTAAMEKRLSIFPR